MNCRMCENVRYGGGCARCSMPGHRDVVLRPGADGRRTYNKEICPDFRLVKRCSNCLYWFRGAYAGDGVTPATRGRCSLGRPEGLVGRCPLWRKGRTSWRKRREDGDCAPVQDIV